VVVVNVVECGVAATGQGGVAAYLWTLGQGAEGAFLWLRCFCVTIACGFQKQNSKLSSRSKLFFPHRGTPEFHYQKQRNYGVYSTQALSNESKQEPERQLEKTEQRTKGFRTS
jgi:hypothetical protein